MEVHLNILPRDHTSPFVAANSSLPSRLEKFEYAWRAALHVTRALTIGAFLFASCNVSAQPSPNIVPGGTRPNVVPGGNIRPTGVGKQQQEDLGLLSLTTVRPDGSSVGCSGVLFANDWGMTAGHCVSADTASTTTVQTSYVNGSGSFTADALYKFGQGANDPTGPDIAIFHLSRPVAIHGNTNDYRMRFWSGASLSGKTIAIFGLSTGAYLAADVQFSSIQGRYIITNPSVTAPGDSGGPAFILGDGGPYLVGINSTAGQTKLANVAAHAVWIVGVTKSQWDMNKSSDTINIDLDEINSTLTPLQQYNNRIDTAPWYYAQRAATSLCMSRRMMGGFFDGMQAGAKIALHCSALGRATWQDVTVSQLKRAASPWEFDNIDAVDWAKARRAAERTCASLGNYSGGHFTGYQVGQKIGLFCYPAPAQLQDSLHSIDLDAVKWFDAAKAAKIFCNSLGSDNGFFNGQQIGSNKGTVCMR